MHCSESPASITSTTSAYHTHITLFTSGAHLEIMARTKNTARKSTGKYLSDLGCMHLPLTPLSY